MKRFALVMTGIVLAMIPGCNSDHSVAQPPRLASPATTLNSQVENAPGKEFVVRRDGFSFSNYGNEDARPANLSPAIIERLCGPNTCARGHASSCVPNAAMQLFMEQANDSMEGGHCEGMSVLAQAIKDEYVPLSTFSANAASTFKLPFTSRVQSEIAYWFATQMTHPAAFSELQITPNQVLSHLERNKETYSIGICMINGTDCHALSPVRVIRKSPQLALIKVYDSNYPGDERRVISTNPEKNTWSYEDYVGTAKSKTLTLTPFSKRIVQQECSPEGNSEDENADEDEREVWVDGEGYIIDNDSADERWSRNDAPKVSGGLSPIYVFKAGKEVKIEVVGKKDATQTKKTNVAIFRQGQSIIVAGIALRPNEKETVVLGKDSDSVSYSTEDSEAVAIRFGMTYKGADYLATIRPSREALGSKIFVDNQVDGKKSQHQLIVKLKANPAQESSSFTAEFTRIGDKADEKFTHLRDIPISAHETVTLEYGKWLKDGQPLSVRRDKDSDGKNDSTQKLNDED